MSLRAKLSRKNNSNIQSEKIVNVDTDDDDDFADFCLKRYTQSSSFPTTRSPRTLELKKSRSDYSLRKKQKNVKDIEVIEIPDEEKCIQTDAKLSQSARVLLKKCDVLLNNDVKRCFQCHRSYTTSEADHAATCEAVNRNLSRLKVREILHIDEVSPEICNLKLKAISGEQSAACKTSQSERETARSSEDKEQPASALEAKIIQNASECIEGAPELPKKLSKPRETTVFQEVESLHSASSFTSPSLNGLHKEEKEKSDANKSGEKDLSDNEFILRVTPDNSNERISSSVSPVEASNVLDELPCPICCKSGLSGQKRLKHIRTCAAKRAMSVREMNAAIELQKKQAEERFLAGLPVVPKRSLNRRPNSRRTCTVAVGTDPDLDVALAISASIHQAETEKEKVMEENMLMEAGMEEAIVVLREDSLNLKPKPGMKLVMAGIKTKNGVKNRLLLTLTKEQRENRTSERVAEILGGCTEVVKAHVGRCPSNIKKCSHIDEERRKKLWELSATGLNNEITKDSEYHIEEIQQLLSPKKLKKDQLDIIDIPGRPLTQQQYSKADETTLDILTELYDLNTSQRMQHDMHQVGLESKGKEATNQDIIMQQPPKEKVSEPLKRLSLDFGSLLGQKEFSDSTVIFADKSEMFTHKVVLWTRCPQLASTVESGSTFDFQFLSKAGGAALINYIYSATIPNTLCLTKGDESQLTLLASQYNLPDLCHILKSIVFYDSNDINDKSIDLIPSSSGESTKNDKHIGTSPFNVKGDNSGKCKTIEKWDIVKGSKNDVLSRKRDPTPDIFDEVVTVKRSKSDECNRVLSPRRLSSKYKSYSESITTKKRSKYSSQINDSPTLRSESAKVESFEAQRICCELSQIPPTSVNTNSRSDQPSSENVAEVIDLTNSEELCFNRDVIDGSTVKVPVEVNDVVFSHSNEELNEQSNTKNTDDSSYNESLIDAVQDNICVEPKIASFKNRNERSCDLIQSLPANPSQIDILKYPSISNQEKDKFCSLPTHISEESASNNPLLSTKFFHLTDKTVTSALEMCNNSCVSGSFSCDIPCEKSFFKEQSQSAKRNCSDEVTDISELPPENNSYLEVYDLNDDNYIHNLSEERPADIQKSPSGPHYIDGDKNVSPVIFEKRTQRNSYHQQAAFLTPQSSKPLRRRSSVVIPDDSFDQVIALVEIEKFENNVGLLTGNSSLRRSQSESSLSAGKGSRTQGKKKNTFPAVTPKPAYETMVTPELKRELDRFGIKPLKRKNAVKILNHIYDETHPFVSDSDPEDQELSPIKSQPSNKNRERNSSKSRQMNLCDSSTEQTDSDSEVIMIEQEPNTEEERLPPSSQLTQSDRLKQFILEQTDIHRKVVLYEPVWLSEIHQKIKEAGIKCSQEKLMDWLDDEGITFRMPTSLSARGKRSRNLITHRS
ncbi:hypothetical protein QYM36_006422 [Artemia franciscana]|uniref:Structure-specific endonuclease subunit SLX4 n=1 Tax=Artemia franciscana TaxID=6661 RepID=A0AA88L3M7_ARTSF|nr:hypothetical protein QYM36_006422 [Artemia franciscana]